MDYQVFMVSRMRKAHDETGNNEEAVALGRPRRQAGDERDAGAYVRLFRALEQSRRAARPATASCARGVKLRPRIRARFAMSFERAVELVSVASRRGRGSRHLRDSPPGGDVSQR
jgi:hypothetical protein